MNRLARTFKMTIEVTMVPYGVDDKPPCRNDLIEAVHGALVTAANQPGEFALHPGSGPREIGAYVPAQIESWTFGAVRQLREVKEGEWVTGSETHVHEEVKARAIAAHEAMG